MARILGRSHDQALTSCSSLENAKKIISRFDSESLVSQIPEWTFLFVPRGKGCLEMYSIPSDLCRYDETVDCSRFLCHSPGAAVVI